MMSISANYEGTYANLMRFVHELDRSPRLLIIEGLNAAPEQSGGNLNISMKIDTFVREDGAAWRLLQNEALPHSLGAEPKKLAILGGLVVVLIVVYFINRTPDVPAAATQPTPAIPRDTGRTNRCADRGPRRNGFGDAGAAHGAQRRYDSGFQAHAQAAGGSRRQPHRSHAETGSAGAASKRALGGRGAQPFRFRRAAHAQDTCRRWHRSSQAAGDGARDARSASHTADAGKAGCPADSAEILRIRAIASSTSRRALFMEGEDIFVAGENDMVNNRFKIIRISANSAVVEDTVTKNQQTLPLVEELPG